MSLSAFLGLLLICAGLLFFLAGSVGLLRFPDVYSRLHALTKADNLGLGLITAGLMVQAESGAHALRLLLIWILVLASGAFSSNLLARTARRRGIPPWSRG